MAMKPALMTLQLWSEESDPVKIDVRMRTVLTWEKMFTGRSMAMLEETRVKLTYLYEIAYVVARAQGLLGTATFTEFGDMYEVSESEEDKAPAPVPTPAEVSAAQ